VARQVFSFFILTFICIALYYLAFAKVQLLVSAPNQLTISDFLIYVGSVSGFWRGKVSNLYDIQQLINYWSEVLGWRMKAAWLTGISPLGVIWFGVFTPLFMQNNLLAQSIWMGLSLAALIFVIFTRYGTKRGLGAPIVLGLVLFSSDLFYQTLLLGQSSILALALLLYLNSSSSNKGVRYQGLDCLALILLAIKPTYFLLGCICAISAKKTRALLVSLFALALSFGYLWLSDSGVVGSYLESLQSYSAADPSPLYLRSFKFELVNNLRSAFVGLMDERSLLSASKWITEIGLLAVLALSCLKAIGSQVFEEKILYTAALSIYLLFVPYAGGYEDMLLVSPLLLVNRSLNYSARSRSIDLVLMLLLTACLNFELLLSNAYLLRWVLKLAYCSLITWVLINQSKVKRQQIGAIKE